MKKRISIIYLPENSHPKSSKTINKNILRSSLSSRPNKKINTNFEINTLEMNKSEKNETNYNTINKNETNYNTIYKNENQTERHFFFKKGHIKNITYDQILKKIHFINQIKVIKSEDEMNKRNKKLEKNYLKTLNPTVKKSHIKNKKIKIEPKIEEYFKKRNKTIKMFRNQETKKKVDYYNKIK
jgi:hypothetical protein